MIVGRARRAYTRAELIYGKNKSRLQAPRNPVAREKKRENARTVWNYAEHNSYGTKCKGTVIKAMADACRPRGPPSFLMSALVRRFQRAQTEKRSRP